jgi:hypothetical protein
VQEELKQEAWLWICAAPQIYDVQSFMDIADKAMKSGYYQERNDRKVREVYYYRLALALGKSK